MAAASVEHHGVVPVRAEGSSRRVVWRGQPREQLDVAALAQCGFEVPVEGANSNGGSNYTSGPWPIAVTYGTTRHKIWDLKSTNTDM